MRPGNPRDLVRLGDVAGDGVVDEGALGRGSPRAAAGSRRAQYAGRRPVRWWSPSRCADARGEVPIRRSPHRAPTAMRSLPTYTPASPLRMMKAASLGVCSWMSGGAWTSTYGAPTRPGAQDRRRRTSRRRQTSGAPRRRRVPSMSPCQAPDWANWSGCSSLVMVGTPTQRHGRKST